MPAQRGNQQQINWLNIYTMYPMLFLVYIVPKNYMYPIPHQDHESQE